MNLKLTSNPAILQQEVQTEAVKHGLGANDDTMIAVDQRGAPVITSYRWWPGREMCLIVELSQTEVLAPLEQFGSTVTGFAVGTLAVAVIAAVITEGKQRLTGDLSRSNAALKQFAHSEETETRIRHADAVMHTAKRQQSPISFLRAEFK